jgi:hypothetical protein
MRLALMQPYFFPYLGYFQLICAVDRFILFDDVQYIQRGWINRNRILKPVEGHQYIQMPIAKHGSAALIKDVEAVPGHKWKTRILRQVEHYHTSAPFYPAVRALLTDCFAFDGLNVARLNGHCLRLVCSYIGIEPDIELSSRMGLDYMGIAGPDEWGLTVSEQLGACEYVNPVGGVAFFDAAKYAEHGVKLTFLTPSLPPYDQRRDAFEPSMSIVDVLMFNSPDRVRAMLDDYKLSEAA